MRIRSIPRARLSGILAAAALAGCCTAAGAPTPPLATNAGNNNQQAGPGDAIPLPLLVPVRGVMAGIVDSSAYSVFKAATSKKQLTEDEWASAGLSVVNLIAASTLITLPSSQPQDAEWIANPEWLRKAADMQNASLLAATAINRGDESSLLKAADLLVDACQSCHDRFRPDLPKTDLTQFASSQATSQD